MSSTQRAFAQRAFAQRNNNVTTLVPVRNGLIYTSEEDTSGGALYTLNIPSVPYVGGIYIVDLSGNDSNGDPIDVSGVLIPPTNGGPDSSGANVVYFNINSPNITPSSPPINPACYPGAEFTIFFKNLPSTVTQFLPGTPFPYFTIGIVPSNGPPIPYIFSPPIPVLFTEDRTQSITLKSNGTTFSVISSGPAGWLGQGLLALLLAAGSVYFGGGGGP